MLLPAHDWLSTRLSHPLEALPSDILHRQPAHTRPATVLIPLLWRPDAPAIVLTQRKTGLRHHAGQISFPGGKLEPDDATARRHLSTSERRAEFT